MNKIVLYAAAIGMFAAVAQAQNENVTWLAPANVSGTSDVNKQGTYYGSWAPQDGGANGMPVNGVHFQGFSDIPNFSANGFVNGYNGFHNPGTGDGNYNALLQYASYDGSGNGTGDTLTWNDVPGHTYLIEIWANDGRGIFPCRTETITGGANTSANLDFGDAPGQYVIGTYVADNSGSETITFSGATSTNGDFPQVNLLLIRDITEGSVTWQTPASISKDSDVSTQGTYFGSWAPYDGSASSEPVNGVTFQGSSDLPGFATTGYNSGYNAYPGSPSGSANYNAILAYGAYDFPGQPYATISWGGMKTGHTYQVEIWDNTGNSGRTDTFTDSSGDSVSVNENGNYVIGTFVATNSEETITESGPFPNINLLQVRDLTPAATVTNYQSAVLADNPLGFWPLNLTDANAANGIATDLSGNGNNGLYEGITPSGNLVAGPTPYITNAASFNTAEVLLGSGSNPDLLDFGGPITMEAWVQPASTTVGASLAADILAKGDDSANNYNELTLRADGGYYYGGTYNNSDGGAHAQGGQQTTNWTYLVSTYDGANWNLYVNSQLVGQSADSVGALEWLQTWAIGNGTADGNGRVFQGNICQVALYNYSLTPAQVLAHYYEAEINASPNASAPILLTEPQAQASYMGGSATFSVTAVSALPMTNQWYKGGVLLPGQTNTTLTVSNLPQGTANYTVVVGNANGSTNATATLTVRVPNNLEWSANGNDGNWNTTSADWLNISNSNQTNFNQGDQVLFDDTPGVPTSVTLSGTVFPSLVTVNSSVNNFSFNSGTISGSGSLVKEGTSTLTITSAGNFTGSATIEGGTVVAGNNVLNSASSITVTNGGTLDFDGSPMTSTNMIHVSGAGVNGEGALYNSGNALYDGSGQQVVDITLTGNTTFGGSSRWDLAVGSILAGNFKLTINNASAGGYTEWDTVAVDPDFGSMEITPGSQLGIKGMGASLGNPSGTITVDNGGTLTFWGSSFGANTGYSKNIVLQDNSTLSVRPQANNTVFNADLTMGTNVGWNYFNGGGAGQVMNGTYYLGGIEQLSIGDSTITFSNVISGPGGFYWVNYNNEMVLAAANTYSGMTAIGSGREVALIGNGSISDSSPIFFGGSTPSSIMLDASGRTDGTLTLASGQTLSGIGAVNGNLVVSPGAIIVPAGTNSQLGITSITTGTLEVTTNVTLNGTTIIKLNGSGNNDAIQAGGNITYGGTLNLVNISGSPLAVGNSFQVFNAATYTGSFASITPSTPGTGLAWNTSQLSSGIISVVAGVSGPEIGSTHISNGNFIFSGTGGTNNGTYYVLTSTNLLTPLSGWASIATNTFTGTGGFSVTNPLSASNHQRFFIIKQ